MRRLKNQGLILLAVALGVFIHSERSTAKDLTHRLGVGYKNQFVYDLPSVAVQYYPVASMGLSAALGVDTQTDNSKLGVMVKVHRILFTEQQMNFYMGAGLGLLSQEYVAAGETKNDSGFELNTFLGAEFFLPGLESLGFSFEAGVAVSSLSAGTRFRTLGDSPLRAGILFYF